jgi:hypothetical protein
MLLVVHGTFSNSTNVMEALSGTKDGRAFLRTARTRYPDGIFAFDHPTLAASPLENAVDLARTFQESRAEVDVIAHSRGGVVTRWWFEMLSPEANQRRKAIFVGSPLAGTSLAAPPRWKSLLDYLTNVSAVIGSTAGAVSFAVPCLTVASGLLRILGSITGLAAKSPLADAAVALVPGLHGQSRVGNQPGLTRLRLGRSPVHARYFAVQSDFEPDPVGWKFWRLLNRPLDRLTDLAADALFDGPNDLVVDVDSMTDVTNGVRVPIERLYDWPRNSRVHHTNYFAQPQLYGKLAEWLF